VFSSLSAACSKCAFDKKPKIPIDVISIKTITATVRYDFKRKGALFQFRYTHDAATNLPTSSATAIMATEIADAVNIAIRPATENHAAIAAIVIAVINVIIGNNIIIPPP
jgi:hypothetical protein